MFVVVHHTCILYAAAMGGVPQAIRGVNSVPQTKKG